MDRFTRPVRLPRWLQPVVGLAVGAIGAAALSALTSQGYLHAAVVTDAGYAGETHPLGPGEQLLMLFAWLGIGGLAGYVGRSGLAFAGLWVGALAGSVVGFLSDPAGNILWLDMVVTVVGITLFLTPGFLLGTAIAGSRDALEPDGSGRRPAPPPLWARGTHGLLRDRRDSRSNRPAPPAGPPSSQAYAPSSYARPDSGTSDP